VFSLRFAVASFIVLLAIGVCAFLRPGALPGPSNTTAMSPNPTFNAVPNPLNDALIAATKNGDLAKAKTLLAQGADVNCRDNTEYSDRHGSSKPGATPLIIAVQARNLALAQVFLDHGADVNAQPVTQVFGHGANVNVRQTAGSMAAIHYAALEGDTAIMQALLARGADVNLVCVRGTTLSEAAQRGHKSAVQLLLKHGAEVNTWGENGSYALASVMSIRRADIVQILLDHGANPNTRDKLGRAVLMDGAENTDVPSVRALLAKGADVNAQNYEGTTPLMKAVGYNLNFMHAMARKISNSEWVQVKKERAIIVQALLDKGAGTKVKGGRKASDLWRAALSGNLAAVKNLLSQGADPNAKDLGDFTALMGAAALGHTGIAQALLSAGAAVDARDNLGRTALLWTAHAGKAGAAKILLQAGADVDARQNGGMLEASTPLIVATYYGHPTVVKVLLAAGADVNAKAGGTFSALKWSRGNPATGVESLLLQAGATE